MQMCSRVAFRAAVMALVGVAVYGGAAFGQCDQWLPGPPLAGVNGQINAISAWDPDGPGPEHARLVAVGDFMIAGSSIAPNIAVLDPRTQRWSGVDVTSAAAVTSDGPLTHVLGAADGRLYVGTPFDASIIEGVYIGNCIAVYEARQWKTVQVPSVVSSAFPRVTSLTQAANGDVLSIGAHAPLSGQRLRGTAAMNTLEFTPEFLSGSLSANALVTSPSYALLPLADGNLILAGDFQYVHSRDGESIVSRNVMRITSDGPEKIEKELNAAVSAAATLSDGRTILAGRFTSSGEVDGLNGVAIYNGQTFVPVVGNAFEAGTTFASIAQHPSGDLYFAGSLVIRGKRYLVARISNGVLFPIGPAYTPPEVGLLTLTSYTPFFLGETAPPASLAILPTGEVYFGGRYTPNDLPLINVARIVNDTFEPASPGVVGTVSTMSSMPDGRLLVAGNFRTTADRRIFNIAAWDGIELRYVAPNIGGPISGAATLPDGRIVATRLIRPTEQASPESRAFMLDGDEWRPLKSGVFTGTTTAAGEPIAIAAFTGSDGAQFDAMARFNGIDYLPLSPAFEALMLNRVALPCGQVLVGRQESASGTALRMSVQIADGGVWKRLGGTIAGEITNFTQLPDGRFITLVSTGSAPAMRVWNDVSWEPFLTNPGPSFSGRIINLLHLATNARTTGELDFIAFGGFSSGVLAPIDRFQSIARFREGAWSNLRGGATMGSRSLPNRATINGVSRLPGGELLAAGRLGMAGGRVSTMLARYTFTGIPTIARQPTAAAPTISAGQTIEVTFTPSPGYSVQYVRWSRDGVPIFNGPGGASPDGGTVIGGAT
ncbi:MAG: hypothetical protein ACK5Q8_09685, partial [Phycisphaerales bacterium]